MNTNKPTYEELERRLAEAERMIRALPKGAFMCFAETAGDRKREQDLRVSEEFYRSVVEDSPGLLCTFLPDGKIVFVNAAYCRYFGKSSEELVGHNFTLLILEEDRQKVLNEIQSLTVDSPSMTHEHRVIHPNGGIRWQRWTNRALFDEQGRKVLYQSFGEDITEFKEAEQRIIESERRFRTLTSSAPVGIFQANAQGNGIYVNEILCTYTGLAAHEHDDTGWAKALHPDDRDRIYQLWMDTVAGKASFETEFRFVSAENKVTWVASQSAPLKDEEQNVIGFIGTLTDITERKRMEEALASEKLLSEEYMNSLPGLFYVFDEQRFVRWNREWERITGYNDEELADKDGTDFFEGEDKILIGERMLKVFREGAADAEAELVTKDGRRIPYYFTGLRQRMKGKDYLVGLGIDITEQKQKENELRISENKYRDLVENVVDVIFTLDPTGHVTNVNTSIRGLLGFEPDEVIGKYFTEWIPKDHQSYILPIFKRVLDGETVIDETILVGRDGKVHHVEFRATCILREGRIVGVQGILRDITEHKHAQEKIESLSRFPSENPSPVLRVSKDGTVLYSNEAALPLLAMLETEVGGVVPAKWRCPIDTAFKSGKTGQQEEEIDGSFFSFVIAPVAEGDYVNLYGRDITKRRKVEAYLRKSEERFQQVVENAGDWIWEIDAEGLFTYVSPVVESVLGYKPEEIVGKKHFYDFFAPEVREDFKKGAFETFAKKEGFRGFVNPNIHRNGSIVILETSGSPIIDENGNLCGYRGADRDITERTQKEKELRELNKELMLASRQAGMAEVATDVLHNVGNVLNSINVSAGFIEDKISNSRAASLKKVVDILTEYTGDLGTFLTNDERGKHIPIYLTEAAKVILDEQAAIAGKLQSLTKSVEHLKQIIKAQQSYARTGGVEGFTSIHEVIEDAVEINHVALERYGVDLKYELAELPAVRIDKQRVLQILVNLLTNAKQALAESEESEKVMTIRSYRHGEDTLRIEVEDNGIGIPKENMPKLFTHGFTTKKRGHGFGLHSSAVAAREMGGNLVVHSNGPGHGAIFILELPLREDTDISKESQSLKGKQSNQSTML